MYCVNHQRSAQTTVRKRKQEVLEEGAPPKKAKLNPQLSPPPLPTPIRSSTVVQTTTSPSIVELSSSDGLSSSNVSSASESLSSSDGLSSSDESSSSDGSSSCDTDFLRASVAFKIEPSTNSLDGIHEAESFCGFGSRKTSTASSDPDSLKWKSPSEPAIITTDRVTIMPSSSNPPFPSSRHALTSQNLTTLQARLNTFLPALHTANQALEVDRAEGRLMNRNIENVSNAEGPYIEMDLSLGVLEAKHAGIRLSDESGSESSTGTAARESSGLAEVGQETQHQPSPKKEKEKDILGKLMGRGGKGSPKAKPKIEVLS